METSSFLLQSNIRICRYIGSAAGGQHLSRVSTVRKPEGGSRQNCRCLIPKQPFNRASGSGILFRR